MFNSQATHLKTTPNNTLANIKEAPLKFSSGSVKNPVVLLPLSFSVQ